MRKIQVIAVVGPTASGKTDAGVRIAQAVDGEVVCVDSRTVYRGMDIGTAKVRGEKGDHVAQATSIKALFEPAPIMVDGVPHWGVDLVDPVEPFSVADFVAYAKKKINDIVARGKVPVLVGGTGLYFRALLDGLTLTDVEPDLGLRAELEAKATEDLVEMLGERDPDAAASIDLQNRRRLVRALEIVMTTGKALKAQQQKVVTPYEVTWIGMEIDRERLYENINYRVDVMVAEGLVDEARGLLAKYGSESQAMSGIGYRQLADFFQGKITLRAAVDLIKTDTRHYAKRQLTWFKADQRVLWAHSVAQAIAFAKSALSM